MKKNALLIFISLFWAFSGSNAAKLAASDNSRNVTTQSAGKIVAESTEQTEEKPNEETDNRTKNVNGIYQSKDADFNEFKIEDADGDLKVEFMGLYEFKTDGGMAMANTDQTDVLTATRDRDTVVVKVPAYPKCRYTLTFDGEKLTVRRATERLRIAGQKCRELCK